MRAPKNPFEGMNDREKMQTLGDLISRAAFPGLAFALLVFGEPGDTEGPDGGPGQEMKWVSNAQRSEAAKALRDYANRLESRGDIQKN